ncbi:hypothetical protein B484DRAFT_38416 [Ochromonadaceae sp. CCMP2298]|nr:hypothetical protein B484DRAFT_38416 [Ochromonadaceae sp. CCMP2298]
MFTSPYPAFGNVTIEEVVKGTIVSAHPAPYPAPLPAPYPAPYPAPVLLTLLCLCVETCPCSCPCSCPCACLIPHPPLPCPCPPLTLHFTPPFLPSPLPAADKRGVRGQHDGLLRTRHRPVCMQHPQRLLRRHGAIPRKRRRLQLLPPRPYRQTGRLHGVQHRSGRLLSF